MSKQRPDADKLANELLGASAFFRPTAKPVEPVQDAPSAPVPPVESSPTPEPKPTSDVMTSRRQDVTTSSFTAENQGFDINRPTASRDSLRLSLDETRALDELRSALKWDYDLTVTKNDICRVALHALLDEFRVKGERSDGLKRLKEKRPSR